MENIWKDNLNITLGYVLDAIDENMFFKDVHGRYILSTHVCEMLNSGGDPNFSIYGKTDMDIQVDKDLGKKFYEEDLEIVKTKEKRKYIQKMVFGSDTYYYEITKNPVIDDKGTVLGIVGIVKDMTILITTQQKLEKYSTLDVMTGIYNRTYYELNKYREHIQYPLGIIVADCNELKKVNDIYGHKSGDKLIIGTVNNIKFHLNHDDIIIRMGGDEFLILCSNYSEADCKDLIKRIKDSEKNKCIESIPMSTSFGFYVMKNEAESIEDGIKMADAMMYKNKKIEEQ